MLSNETFWVIDKDCENGQKMLYPILKTSTAAFRLSFVTIIWEEGGLKACQNSVPFWHKKRAFFSLPNSKSYSRVLGDWHKNAKQGFMDVQISDRQRCLWHFFNIWWCFLKIDQKCLEDFWVQNAIHSFTYLLCLPCLPKFFCHFSHLEIEKLSFWVVEKWKGLYCESDKLIVSAG